MVDNKTLLHLPAKVSEFRNAIMGCSMLVVMYFHRFYFGVPDFNFPGYLGVDVFLFLSGMGICNSLQKHSMLVYYKRRFLRLFPACLLCGVCKVIFILVSGVALPYSTKTFFCFDLWFIPTLLFYYFVSPLLRKLTISYPLILMLIAYIPICLLLVNPTDKRDPVFTTWTIERFPAFCLGMLFMSYGCRISICRRVVCLFLLVTAFMLKYFILVGMLSTKGLWLISPLFAAGLPMVLYVIVIVINALPSKLTTLLSFVGRHSLELYLIHEFVFQVCHIFWRGFLLAQVQFVLSSMLSLLFAIGCRKIIKYLLKNN